MRRSLILSSAAASLVLVGCVPNSPADAEAIAVTSTDDACEIASSTAASGTVTFDVTNDTDRVTEFYVLADDQLRIVGEVENVTPGATRQLVVQIPPGDYFTVCKPGMVGDGVGLAAFAVSDSGEEFVTDENTQALIDAATEAYASYVREQSQQLLEETQTFADTYVAGDDDQARELYATTRMSWERIEPVAESFGDLDPRIDAREADLAQGEAWTGWHAIEKDLWPPTDGSYTAFTTEERTALAEQLTADTAELQARSTELTFTLDQLTNGAIALLDEVANGKVTGEEEAWSHTDLWDFQANIEGAVVLYEGVRDIVAARDEELAGRLDSEFDALQSLLDTHRVGDGFALYTDLTPDEIQALSDQVNALAEPLSGITAVVLS